jgi:hypothetical protein
LRDIHRRGVIDVENERFQSRRGSDGERWNERQAAR